jgi:hypothetical protein
MTVLADKSNSPLRRTTRKALKRLETLAAKYEASGLSKKKAKEKATAELRANTRADWKVG